MKSHLITFEEPNSIFSLIFKPNHSFKTEWCIDYHGYLTVSQLEDRINRINEHIKEYTIISELVADIMKWLIGIFAAVIAIAVTSAGTSGGSGIGGLGKRGLLDVFDLLGVFGKGIGIGGFLYLILYKIGKFILEKFAEDRLNKFKEGMEEFFRNGYNKQDYPMAYWRVELTPVLSKYKLEMTSMSSGSAKPKYVEQIKLYLDINDALSDLTSDTVSIKVQIPSKAEVALAKLSKGSSYGQTPNDDDDGFDMKKQPPSYPIQQQSLQPSQPSPNDGYNPTYPSSKNNYLNPQIQNSNPIPTQQLPIQQHSTQQHPTQQHSIQQHPTQQNSTQQHPTQQQSTQQHLMQQHSTQQRQNRDQRVHNNRSAQLMQNHQPYA
jgi:hypothetical protein